jgi:predicted amidohydrolase
MKFKVAVAQLEIAPGNMVANIIKAEKFIKKASEKGAQLFVLPEDFATGPINGEKELIDKKKEYVKTFQKFAKKYEIDIVPGSVIEKEKGKMYNTTYYISSDGKIKGSYRKINPYAFERTYITPGNKITVINTKFGKVGLIICWDIMSPGLFREMIKKGAEIIVCTSLWGVEDAFLGLNYDKNTVINLVDSLCPARAFENGVAMIYCNAAGKFKGKDGPLNSIGHSQVALPFYGTIKKLDHNKEEMFTQEIDIQIIKDAEDSFWIRKGLKKEQE